MVGCVGVDIGYVSDISFPSDDDEEIIEYIARHERRARIVNERKNYFAIFDDVDFLRRFRISKETALFLLEHIEDRLEFRSDKNNAVSPADSLLLTLRFYATGCHLLTAADFIGVSKSTAFRIVHRVTEAIASLRPRFINLPTEPRQMREIQIKLYNKHRFPRVIGVMDCTHGKIQSPGGDDAEIFRNGKVYFSINVQTISDSDLIIRDIVARWPGSAHDSTIFNDCEKRAMFEAGLYCDAILVDGGCLIHN